MEPDTVRTSLVPATSCPGCGERLEHVTGTDAPTAGQIVLCAYCRIFLVFTPDLHLCVLSNQQWAALSVERRIALTHLREGLGSQR